MWHRRSEIFQGNPDPADDVFFQRLDLALETLDTTGYEMRLEEEEEFPDGALQIVWEDDGDRVNVTIVRTPQPGFTYLVVTGAKRRDVNEVHERLYSSFDFASLASLQEEAERRLLFSPEGLVKMAIAAGERADSVTLDLVRRGLVHRGPRTRYNAAVAAAHCRWSDLAVDLETMLRDEQEDDVREAGEHALALCRKAR